MAFTYQLTDPVSAVAVPLPHGTQAICPDAGCAVPVGHTSHEVLPLALVNLPL